MSRILAIDHGTHRIGLALSDALRIFAKPYKVIPNTGFKKVLEQIKDVIDQENVELIVLGMPWAVDGSKTRRTVEVESFGAKLKKNLEIKMVSWDERYSSCEADEAFKSMGLSWEKSKASRDAMAAAMILKSYLENNENL